MANHSTGHPFEAIDEDGNRHFGVAAHQQMDMVLPAIKLHQFRFKVVTDTGKDALEIAEHIFGKHLSPVFCDEDQVHVHLE